MDPDAFEWQRLPGDPGVEIKPLGTFTEKETTISMVRWTADGTFGLEPGRTQLVVSLESGIEIDGEAYPALTGITSEIDDELALHGRAGTEAVVVTLPRG